GYQLSVYIHGKLFKFVYIAVFSVYRNRTVNDTWICFVDGHAATIALLDILCLMKMTSSIGQICLLPFMPIPFYMIVIMCLLVFTSLYHGNNWPVFILHAYFPSPVSERSIFHTSIGIAVFIGRGGIYLV